MIPKRSFYILRHGESEANAADIIAGGGLDSPLNDMGRGQAHCLREAIKFLEETRPDRIYHSHQSRARETAQIVNEALGLDMHEHPHIHEHFVGEWEGQPGELFGDRLRAGETPPGGESPDEFSECVRGAFTEILEGKPEETPLVVCHGGVFAALGRLFNRRINRISNCHLHFFEALSFGDDEPTQAQLAPPAEEAVQVPFRIWHYDVEDGKLKRRPSPHCPSQDTAEALEKEKV